MSNPGNSPHVPGLEDNPLILADFVNALQRLFRIGVYYPSGHTILDQATDRFLALVRSLAHDRHFIRIEDDGKSLLLEQIRLDPSQSFVGEFRQLMGILSITAIEISRNISGEDMHTFIRKMIAGRSQGANIKQFSSVEITDLPATIHITPKEYLAREGSSTADRLDSAAKNLNAFFDALEGHGLTGEQIEQCRLLLASLPDRMKKIAQKSGELPSASWDDIAMLLANAVQGKPLVGRSTSHGNLDMLAAILSNLEEETQDKKSREAINLLVSILKKPIPKEDEEENGEEVKRGHAGRDVRLVSVAEMQDFADGNRLNPSALRKVQDIPTENETLSVMLQLAGQRQSLPVQARMQQFFNDIFTVPLQDKTWDILVHGLLAIVRIDDQVNLVIAVRIITEALRRSEHAEPLELFHRALRLCRGTEENILWPFAVNELLVSGSGAGGETFHQLCTRLARLSWKDMIQAMPMLQSLDAFQRGKVAAGVFTELAPSCYPLCAFLLRTAIAPQIEGHVIAGLKNAPADSLMKAVGPLLDAALPGHKTFLERYLRQSVKRETGDGLKAVAGDIIIQGLSTLPQELREQPWVPETIAAIGDFQGNGGRELLNQIVTAKRLLLLPEWPAACRTAAEGALGRLQKRPRTMRTST